MTAEEAQVIRNAVQDLEYLRTIMLPKAPAYVKAHITELRTRLEALVAPERER